MLALPLVHFAKLPFQSISISDTYENQASRSIRIGNTIIKTSPFCINRSRPRISFLDGKPRIGFCIVLGRRSTGLCGKEAMLSAENTEHKFTAEFSVTDLMTGNHSLHERNFQKDM